MLSETQKDQICSILAVGCDREDEQARSDPAQHTVLPVVGGKEPDEHRREQDAGNRDDVRDVAVGGLGVAVTGHSALHRLLDRIGALGMHRPEIR